jgi:hypothetical protein
MKKKSFSKWLASGCYYLLHPAVLAAKCILACPLSKKLSDEAYLKLKYLERFKKRLNLKTPKTYNEKLQWLKLYDRNPEYTIMVDKYAMKEWVASRIGEGYTIQNYGIWNDPKEIDFDKLPNQFVLKGTHDSGSFCICKDKNNFDRESAIIKLEKSMSKDQYIYSREWPYKNVPRRILAEEYIEDESGYELKDYKFFCFDGKPYIMFIASGRTKGETTFDYYDMNFNHLEIAQSHPNAEHGFDKPKEFNKMIELASKLSAGIPQLRVDFYYVNGKIYVGELTFFHYGGFYPFYPEKWDTILGDLIKLPNKSKTDNL